MARKVTILLLLMITVLGSTSISNGNDGITEKKLLINIPARTLTFLKNNKVEKVYPVAVGKPTSKTPLGSYKVLNKVVNPYYSRKKIPGGNINNPLGIRWMGFKSNYGIHGNSAPDSIGTTASGGCVRMYNYDVKELYEKVDYQTKVEIVYSIFQTLETNNSESKAICLYPDVYRNIKNVGEVIERQLELEGIKEQVLTEKIQEAVTVVKSKTAVLSKKWAVVLNNHYVTTDTYFEENQIYLGENVVKNYFGLILNETRDKVVPIESDSLKYMDKEGRKYISLNSLATALGGELEINEKLQNAWLNTSIVKLNNIFLERNLSDLVTHKPLIPIQKLQELLKQKHIEGNKITYIHNEKHLDLEEAQKNF